MNEGAGSWPQPSRAGRLRPSLYHVAMTVKERLHQLVDSLDDEQGEHVLELLEGLVGVVPTQRLGQQRPRPAFVGMGHGPADLAERSEELLHEFGEQPLR